MYWPGRPVDQEWDVFGRAVNWVQMPDLYSSLEKSNLKKPMQVGQQNGIPDELIAYELALWT
jgi:hypothetical protein